MIGALAFLWGWLRKVPYQVWLAAALIGSLWWWHSSAVNRAVDACNASWEAKVAEASAKAEKEHTDAQGAIAKDAEPANAQARKTLEGIAGEVRKLREAKTPVANAGCVASPEAVNDVNALR